MARPRTPTAKLKLHGTYNVTRHRGRKDEPQPEGKPVRPDDMPEDAQHHWDTVVSRLVKLGIATDNDSEALHEMCLWWAIMRELHREDGNRNERWQYRLANATKVWRDYASRFGMTPADRAKLELNGNTTTTELDDLIA